MNRTVGFIIISVVYVLLAIYISYLVINDNRNRDQIVFDKFKFKYDTNAVASCNKSKSTELRKELENDVNMKLTTLLDEKQSKTQCLATPKVNSTPTSTTTPITTPTTSTT